MATKKTLMIWESEVTRTGPESVSITAKRPLDTLTAKQASTLLSLGVDGVYDLYQAGVITGFKPGARTVRRDGRASNAALRLNAASVLEYRQRQLDLAKAERGA